MRRAVLLSLVVLVAAFAVWRGRKEPRTVPAVSYHGGRLDRLDGLAVLRLHGTPREKGRAHGESLKGPIRARLDRLRPADEGEARFALQTCGGQLRPFLPAEVREELAGLAEGAGITEDEALFLNTHGELAAYGFTRESGAEIGYAGDAAVGDGPEVLKVFGPGDLGGRAADLVVFVHEDVDPPLVLVGLPGMVGGFLGLRGPAAAAGRPRRSEVKPVLHGLVWPLLLRALLEAPAPDGAWRLPQKPTLEVSLPFRRADGVLGTLNLGPPGGTFYAAGAAFAGATDEAVTGEGGAVDEAPRAPGSREVQAEEARRLLTRAAAGDEVLVRLKGGDRGVAVAVETNQSVIRAVVRYWQ